uniref:Uncharacterized protein n=1 Tax=Stomoxys calcitrans TaxID=35570 RepID=A0A1I8Q405_STOCA
MASQANNNNNMAQLKNQQHQQASMSQQHAHHASAPIHHQQPQQQQSGPHPGSSSGNSNIGVHHLATAPQSLATATLLPNGATSSSTSSSTSTGTAHMPAAQFVDKESAMQEVLKHFTASAEADDDLSDSFQILKELKRETNSGSAASTSHTQAMPPPPPPFGSGTNYPWNMFTSSPYHQIPMTSMPPIAGLFPQLFNPFEGYQPSPFPVTPRFMPFMGYAQPILVPYPLYMAPEMFYPGFSAAPMTNEFEDSMSRGAGASRRPASSSRNSPIYYVRLPPTPYMFLPSLGLGTATSTGFPTVMPYQSLPSFPPFSSIFNVPINFLANGKPGNVYQMGGLPNDVQNPLQYSNGPGSYANRPPTPPGAPQSTSHSIGHGYRPPSSLPNYYNGPPPPPQISAQNYGSYGGSGFGSAPSSSPQSLQDSKLTSLKRPYFFNGRPEDIYVLPNNFNPLYSSENSYY